MLKDDYKRKEKEYFFKTKNVWLKYRTPGERKKVFNFSSEYSEFLNTCKTEREVVAYLKNKLTDAEYSELIFGKKNSDHSNLFLINRGKNIAIIKEGTKGLMSGANIIVAHIDSPRLDLKQNPLYEDCDIAMLKTHYYGGIKKYQWLNIPLAMHGRIMLKNGKALDINIGQDPSDPVFLISDLLPHLSHKVQDKKKASEFIEAEKMNVLAGSMPFDIPDLEEPVKFYIMDMLNMKYGIVERDFLTAEIELVPALPVRDGGFDRSMIFGYGHDDRSCAYSAFRAIFDTVETKKTSIVVLTDKEEIGSDGSTGLNSSFLHDLMGEVLYKETGKITERDLRVVLNRSNALSADVNSVINPSFQDVQEKNNASKLNHGVIITKFTGSGGKYSASDADAEYVYKLIELFDSKKINWQIGEIGKVDEGGGGTVAKYIAYWGINVVDCGIGVMGMHSPYEVISKGDLYETYNAYKLFLEKF